MKLNELKNEIDRVKILQPELENIVDNHQDISLVLDQRLRDKGTKSAFYGFNQLKQFKNLIELKNTINEFKRTIN